MKKPLLLLSSTALLMSNLFGTVYSDGTNPEDWKLYTTTQGEVGENDGAIEFKGNGKQGFYLPLNVKSKSSDSYKLSWKMKSKRYSQTLIQIMTKDGIRYLSYYPTKNTHGKSGRFLKFGLDKTLTNGRSRDGQWHTFTKDIKSDLKKYEPNNELVEIKAMLVRGTVLIDDVEVNKNNNNNPENDNFDFKKFDELLKAEDKSDGWLYLTEIEETGDPRIKVVHTRPLMDGPTFTTIYTLSKDNTHLVVVEPGNPYGYYNSAKIKVSKDKKKLIIDAEWKNRQYIYKEIDITNLPNVHEITHSKSKLFDIVGKIAEKSYNKWGFKPSSPSTHIYEVKQNGETRYDIIGIAEIFYSSTPTNIAFYMMDKSGDKAVKILQTKMSGHVESKAIISAGHILNLTTFRNNHQNYNISKCLNGATEGCAELIN